MRRFVPAAFPIGQKFWLEFFTGGKSLVGTKGLSGERGRSVFITRLLFGNKNSKKEGEKCLFLVFIHNG